MRKYEFTNEYIIVDGKKLYRVRAIRDIYTQIGIIESGTIGGFIESEDNLSHDGGSWVMNNARVYGNAQVYEDACVYGNAWVFRNALVYENALVYGNARVFGNVQVYGNARVSGSAWVSGNAQVYGDALVFGDAHVYGDACVSGNAQVYENSQVFGNAQVYENACVSGNAHICKNAAISSNEDYIVVKGVSGEQTPLTFFLTNKSTIMVDSRWYHGILEEFRDKIKLISDDDLRQEYTDLVTFVKRKFARILKKRS